MGKISYTRGSLTYIGHQPIDYSGGHMDDRRTNDLLLLIRANEGTSNTMFKGDNEGVDEEEDVDEEKGAWTQTRGRSKNLSEYSSPVQMVLK
ncbi:hypothetical protein J1N35_018423 [Gossypium stocksii]|uniref:Uncharacterized protein n=1 Tax=Gossypium stocksii TaxID=47602 RepID=A0A9D4A777_9ROSI|nr:hypothetical protein J1N35_018423 [Gossypium stocksii]